MHLQHQNYSFSPEQPAGPAKKKCKTTEQYEQLDLAKSPKTRRDDAKYLIDLLERETHPKQPGQNSPSRKGQRQNKNEILCLTLARLIKQKHLKGNQYSRDIEFTNGIRADVHYDGFILVLRTDGRIVAMSSEAEQHLGKSMRSLYTQCTDIFECLEDSDRNRLRSILNSSVNDSAEEYKLVCNLRLPKGKRPSRIREDVTTITMTGHFYSCNESSLEKLFIARCEAVYSQKPSDTNSAQISMMNDYNKAYSAITITLNDDMSIRNVSSNVQDILGYSRNEIITNWIGRYLSTDDLNKFEKIRLQYLQNEQQQSSNIIHETFDIYTHSGDGRLSFLFQIRPIRERRMKSTRFQMIGQLIDPGLINEYSKYVQLKVPPPAIQAEQVNFGSETMSFRDDATSAIPSPTLACSLLPYEYNAVYKYVSSEQSTPNYEQFSGHVSPSFTYTNESCGLLEFSDNQYALLKDLFDEPIKDYPPQGFSSLDDTLLEYFGFEDDLLIT